MPKTQKLAEREAVTPSIKAPHYSRGHTDEGPRTIPRKSIDFVASLPDNKRHEFVARK